MMDEDERVVDMGVSRFGLHRLHVIRMGKPVEMERWIDQYVPMGGRVETHLAFEEPGLGLHHLYLYWRMEIASQARNDAGIASQARNDMEIASQARNDMEVGHE